MNDKIKTVKIQRHEEVLFKSMRTLISKIPYRVRLEIIRLIPLYVILDFNSRRIGKVGFSESSKSIQVSTSFSQSERESFTITARSNDEEKGNEKDLGLISKEFPKNLYGYFKHDITRKLFPIFRHFVSNGKSPSNLFNLIPSYNLDTLIFCGPNFEEQVETNKISCNKIKFEFNGVRENEDVISRIKKWNLVLDRTKFIKHLEFKIYFEDSFPYPFCPLDIFNLETFQRSLTRVKSSGFLDQFQRYFEYFKNLKSFNYSFREKSDLTLPIKKEYNNISSLKVSGHLTNDILEFICFSFPKLRSFKFSDFASTKVTREGWISFFKNSSDCLRRIQFSFNESLVDNFFLKSNETNEHIKEIYGYLCKPEVEEVRFIRWNPVSQRWGACHNGIFPLTLPDVIFLNVVFPNVQVLQLDICTKEQAEYVKQEFKSLKRLIMFECVYNLTTIHTSCDKWKLPLRRQTEEDKSNRLNSLTDSTIHSVEIYANNISDLLKILKFENLSHLRFSCTLSSEYLCEEEDEYRPSCLTEEDARRINQRLSAKKNSRILEIMKKVIDMIQNNESKIRKLEVYLGGTGWKDYKDDAIFGCFEIINYFKKDCMGIKTSVGEETEGVIGKINIGNYLQEFVLGGLDGWIDNPSFPPTKPYSTKDLFIWRRDEGIWFECNQEELRKDVKENYENDDCTIL